MDATPEQARAALEWKAEEAAASRRVDAQVAQLEEGASPQPSPLSPEAQVQAQQAAQLAAVMETQLPKLCGVAWAIVDRLVQQMAGAELALTPAERAELAAATVPVVNKYLPQGMDWLVKTPEGALALTAGMIYGFKLVAPSPAAPAPTPPATQEPAAA